MKKLFNLGFTACLTAAFVFSGCTKDDDDDSTNKKGKQLLSQLCEYTENGVSYQELNEYKYDSKGNQIENNYTRTEDGAVTHTEKRVHEYDNKGNLTKFEYSSSNDGETTTDLEESKYDNQGHEIERINTYSRNGEILSTTTTKHKYNDHGDQTEYEYTSGDYSDKSTYEYEYDAEGNKTKQTYYYNGEFNNICEYAYVGDTVKLTYYDKDGSIIGKETNVFVTVNNVKRLRASISENGSKVVFYNYDIDNKEGIEQYWENGMLMIKSITVVEGNTSTNTYENYNSGGELIAQGITKYVYTNSDRTDILTYEYTQTNQRGGYKMNTNYTYDENGNLIGKKEFYDDQLTSEDKDFVYDGKTVTYTNCRYNRGETTPYRTSYYTLTYK